MSKSPIQRIEMWMQKNHRLTLLHLGAKLDILLNTGSLRGSHFCNIF